LIDLTFAAIGRAPPFTPTMLIQSHLESVRTIRRQLLDLGDEQSAGLLAWADADPAADLTPARLRSVRTIRKQLLDLGDETSAALLSWAIAGTEVEGLVFKLRSASRMVGRASSSSEDDERETLAEETLIAAIRGLAAQVESLATDSAQQLGVEFQDRIEELEREVNELQQVTWPDWASQILKLVRSRSGNDGFDDGDGIDLVEEVRECLEELDRAAAQPKLNESLLIDLREATATLRQYEANHRAKGTAKSVAKAEVNAALAQRFEGTISKALISKFVEERHSPSAASDEAQGEALPMQPIHMVNGVIRFKANALVRRLLDHGTATGCDMNALALIDAPDEDHQQFAQLIGYSVSGYGDLSYVTPEACERADRAAEHVSLTLQAGPPAEAPMSPTRSVPGHKEAISVALAKLHAISGPGWYPMLAPLIPIVEAAIQKTSTAACVPSESSKVATSSEDARQVTAGTAPIAFDDWRRALAEMVDAYIQLQADNDDDDALSEAYAKLLAHIRATPFEAQASIDTASGAPQSPLPVESFEMIYSRLIQGGYEGRGLAWALKEAIEDAHGIANLT
jgi:hypothetical protein